MDNKTLRESLERELLSTRWSQSALTPAAGEVIDTDEFMGQGKKKRGRDDSMRAEIRRMETENETLRQEISALRQTRAQQLKGSARIRHRNKN